MIVFANKSAQRGLKMTLTPSFPAFDVSTDAALRGEVNAAWLHLRWLEDGVIGVG